MGETVHKQSVLIDELEARLNKLTNKKLEIEGQQQQRANMTTKKEELELKVESAGEKAKKCELELEPIKEQLEEMESNKRNVIREGEQSVEALLDRQKKVERCMEGIHRLDTKI